MTVAPQQPTQPSAKATEVVKASVNKVKATDNHNFLMCALITTILPDPSTG